MWWKEPSEPVQPQSRPVRLLALDPRGFPGVADHLRSIARHRLLVCLFWAILPYLFLLSKYSVWWGGHCFGPRYWTDVTPLFGILLAFTLDRAVAESRARVVLSLFALTILFSIAFQALGALSYPTSWNLKPENVDQHHARLWDWHDTELRRCITEYPGYHPIW